MNAEIMLVEDDRPMREYLVDLLESHGYHVTAVPDGPAMLRFFEPGSAPFDLLLCDVRLPGALSGLDLIRDLRAAGEQVRALVISAFGSPTVRSGARQLGAAYLDKPFPPDRLLALVRSLIRWEIPAAHLEMGQGGQQ